MHIQHDLYTRSTIDTHSNGGGLGPNTIIFIVLGVVCLLAILIGFYLVSRPRGACEAAPNVASLHSHHSPATPTPPIRCKRDVSEHWKILGIWRHTGNTAPPNTAEFSTSQLSPPSVTGPAPFRIARGKGGQGACPTVVSRPSQSRRVTSLSVATSFSHSHITEEALSELRASAYDLDGDLETEMIHSAMDDVWTGRPEGMEHGCGDVGMGAMEAGGHIAPIAEGSVEVEGEVPTRPATKSKGDDYGNLGACTEVARHGGSDGSEGGLDEVDRVPVG